MKIKFCPKCGNIEIEDVTETAQKEMFYHYGSPRLYKCSKCEFANTLFPEVEKKDLKKIQKEIKLKMKFNPALMKFEPDLESLSVKKKKERKQK